MPSTRVYPDCSVTVTENKRKIRKPYGFSVFFISGGAQLSYRTSRAKPQHLAYQRKIAALLPADSRDKHKRARLFDGGRAL